MSLLKELSPDEKTTAAMLLVRKAETLEPGPERMKLLQAAEQLLSAEKPSDEVEGGSDVRIDHQESEKPADYS